MNTLREIKRGALMTVGACAVLAVGLTGWLLLREPVRRLIDWGSCQIALARTRAPESMTLMQASFIPGCRAFVEDRLRSAMAEPERADVTLKRRQARRTDLTQTLPSSLVSRSPTPPSSFPLAPDFKLAGLNGPGLSLKELNGRPAVINFFASWCIPCREEQPLLIQLAKREHVPLYGIDYKDKAANALRLLTQLGDPYRRIGIDSDGQVGLNFGMYGVPETYVLDKTGHIRKRFVGPLTTKKVDNELLPLLKQLGES